MIKRFIKINWICLLLGMVGFILSVILHYTPTSLDKYSIASGMISQGIIVFCMMISLLTSNGLYKDIKQSGIHYKIKNIISTIIFSSSLLIMLRGITLLNFSAMNKTLLVILTFALINGLVVFQFLELIYLIICLFKTRGLN